MIDKYGMRAGIGIIVCKNQTQVLIARRSRGRDSWQFPQGGIHEGETPEQAMWRELHEEIGLSEQDCKIIYSPENWFSYYLPQHLIRRNDLPLCKGQKQKWFVLQLVGAESQISFTNQTPAEFNAWKWVDYWQPAKKVIAFKSNLYQDILNTCAPHLESLPED